MVILHEGTFHALAGLVLVISFLGTALCPKFRIHQMIPNKAQHILIVGPRRSQQEHELSDRFEIRSINLFQLGEQLFGHFA